LNRQARADRKIRTLRPSEEKKHLDLLNLCHNPWGDEQRWKKMYLQEAFDLTKNVLVVEENGEWAGGVTAWFRDAFLAKDKTAKAAIAGDGYVLPNQRGKGLYSFYMKAVNKMAKERGATLGIGFVSAYNLPPLKALPKIGFAKALFPVTKILVLNPEKFLNYMINESTREFQFPKEFERMRFQVTVTFNSYKGKATLCRNYIIEKAKLLESCSQSPSQNSKDKTDLQITTDIETLTKIVKGFNAGKNRLLFTLCIAILRRRLRLRVSFRLLKTMIHL